MSGLVVLRAVLVGDPLVTAAVPVERIVADELPLDTPLPALSITMISSVDRKALRRSALRRVAERVQVTILARDATERLDLTARVRAAAEGLVGDVAGIAAVSIQSEGQGPDLTTEAGIRIRTQDFIVSFNEPTAIGDVP